MDLAEDLAPFFADFGEGVTVAGASVRGLFSTASQVVLGDAITSAPTLEVPATVAATEGSAVSIRGVAYLVRQVLDQEPDGALRTLVLSRS
jgi:hypothetical protein